MNRIYGVGDPQSLRLRIDFLTGANPIYSVGDDSVVSINFGRNPDIKFVHLTGISVEVEMAELEWLMNFLSDIGASSQVEEIKFDVDISESPVDWSLWEGVDHILAGMNFQSLRKVNVELSGWWLGSSDPDWFRASCKALAANLPLLRAGGILGPIN
jgi:hypothetical protein